MSKEEIFLPGQFLLHAFKRRHRRRQGHRGDQYQHQRTERINEQFDAERRPPVADRVGKAAITQNPQQQQHGANG